MIEAELILGLCDRFGCTPDVAEELDVRYLRMMKIYDQGKVTDNGE